MTTLRKLLLSVLHVVVTPVLCAAEASPLPILYPFCRDDKWGYIDATGAWVIPPQFERCFDLFDGERVRVWQGQRWGYIDRTGRWIAPPRFTDPIEEPATGPYEVVHIGARQGVLDRAGKLRLPAKYDAIVLFGDRAWVKSHGRLGLYSLDGHGIIKPSISWPKSRGLPTPAEGGVSWFKVKHKWGLFSAEGKVLFKPQFAEHIRDRHEWEDWDHPEGFNFKNGRAWVMAGQRSLRITAEGKVLARLSSRDIRPWTHDLWVFMDDQGQSGLVTNDGRIALAARFTDIKMPGEGMAVVYEQKTWTSDSKLEFSEKYGYIDIHGKLIVAPGAYRGPTDLGGELAPFSDGLAPVSNDGHAGYIDRTGALVIPEQFRETRSFAEGLGPVCDVGPGPEHALRWGYVDKTGAVAIPLHFADVTPFCHGRAWVLKPGGKPNQALYAMIDRSGNVLTDYIYDLPERRKLVYDPASDPRFWDKDAVARYNPAEILREARWRDDLAMLNGAKRYNPWESDGLATADGKVLFKPTFLRINEFHDGIAVAIDSRAPNEKGDTQYATVLLTKDGRVLADDTYTSISEFDQGVAWASHRWTDPYGYYHHESWGLIDTSARELCEVKYDAADWVEKRRYSDTAIELPNPKFHGDLARIGLADWRKVDKVDWGNAWRLESWGYINRAGKIVVWHEGVSGKFPVDTDVKLFRAEVKPSGRRPKDPAQHFRIMAYFTTP